MKKISLLLITAIVISFTAKSQITLKKLEFVGDRAILKTDAGVHFLTIKPITHYWIEYTPADTIIMISGNNKQFSFAIRTQNEFIVNGSILPVNVNTYIAELNAIIAASSTGSGATESTLQIIANQTEPIATTNVIQEIEVTTAVSGSILAGARFISVANIGTANAIFNGVTIYPNQANTYPVILQKPYGTIAYTGAVGAILKIINIR